MHGPFKIVATACAAIVLTSVAASAETAPAPKASDAANRMIQLFVHYCVNTLPDFDKLVAQPVQDSMTPMTGQELESRTNAAAMKPRQLQGWKFTDSGAELALYASQSDFDEQMNADIPEFAGGTSYSCNLAFIKGGPRPSEIAPGLVAAFGRQADGGREEGDIRVLNWIGVSDTKITAFEHHAPTGDRLGGMLSFLVLLKP